MACHTTFKFFNSQKYKKFSEIMCKIRKINTFDIKFRAHVKDFQKLHLNFYIPFQKKMWNLEIIINEYKKIVWICKQLN